MFFLGKRNSFSRVCWFCHDPTSAKQISACKVKGRTLWFCSQCDNYFYVNDVTGEIDTEREAMFQDNHNNRVRFCSLREKDSISNGTSSFFARNNCNEILCKNCSNHQEIITNMMAEFDVPGSRQDRFLEEAASFRRDLEIRYPLCLHCQRKVDDILRKQAFAFRGKLLDFVNDLCCPKEAKVVERHSFGHLLLFWLWVVVDVGSIFVPILQKHHIPIIFTVASIPALFTHISFRDLSLQIISYLFCLFRVYVGIEKIWISLLLVFPTLLLALRLSFSFVYSRWQGQQGNRDKLGFLKEILRNRLKRYTKTGFRDTPAVVDNHTHTALSSLSLGEYNSPCSTFSSSSFMASSFPSSSLMTGTGTNASPLDLTEKVSSNNNNNNNNFPKNDSFDPTKPIRDASFDLPTKSIYFRPSQLAMKQKRKMGCPEKSPDLNVDSLCESLETVGNFTFDEGRNFSSSPFSPSSTSTTAKKANFTTLSLVFIAILARLFGIFHSNNGILLTIQFFSISVLLALNFRGTFGIHFICWLFVFARNFTCLYCKISSSSHAIDPILLPLLCKGDDFLKGFFFGSQELVIFVIDSFFLFSLVNSI